MDLRKCSAPSQSLASPSFSSKGHSRPVYEDQEMGSERAVAQDLDIDRREIYFLMLHFLSTGPCRKTFEQFYEELSDHHLLPRRYHAWYSRSGVLSGQENDDGISFPSSYSSLVERYPHIDEDHLVKLFKQLMLNSASSLRSICGRSAPSAANGPTLLGTGSFSLLGSDRTEVNEQVKAPPAYLRWPHMQSDQVRGLTLREIGGGFRKHHRAPSLHLPCYTIAKPSTMFQKMENTKRIRGHRSAVYCAIFDRSGRYVITGSDDRLVKIWSMETALCLASCRGHEGDITDLAVSSNNALVASASNDFSIRVWRLPDGYPISVLRGHVGAVTAIAFSPRQSSLYQLLSSSDDGTCRIWDARSSDCRPRVYLPRPIDGKSSGPSSSNGPPSHQILCCSYNANGTLFVTGSSDTFARVWSACKSNASEVEQPNHEIDLLAGHENDVNYVQFSGCAVAPRSTTLDSLSEDNKQRFRNSWFNHDNIVTCSRDGSAIIWAQKSRKSHGKAVRWSQSYHLKVPPPPMILQPPSGGPRQRFLPTPRGVNMIVWSLDNRFVLAAIMDCRICVWNASDGSLVHSLTGHTQSTYVLDVHPFNPRIAMSAGYDGKTIVWDIWEGLPIKIYNIGQFKLVDGKFSQDGTSIVLSDDAGQIYLLNTGQGESQKDAKYDQFFLGDYRPLILDTLGNVVDQETNLPPYRRNIQDALCDGSMMPYPEPYQSVYQRRRLGALGIEWRPSPIKFAIGTDIGLGPELLPLADLDAVIEPLPEFIDSLYWDFDNEVVPDDTDSEYNIAEENSSEGEEQKRTLPSRSQSDSDCSTEDDMFEHDGLRRSKRRKDKSEVKLMSYTERRPKRRSLEEIGGSSSRTKKAKKQKNGRTSKRKSIKEKSLRPQRAAARNALSYFSKIQGSSSEEEGESYEDDSSESETILIDSDAESKEQNLSLLDVQSEDPKADLTPLHTSEEIARPKRLVLKFSIRDKKKSEKEYAPPDIENQADLESRLSSPSHEASERVGVNFIGKDLSSGNANATSMEISVNRRTESSNKIPIEVGHHLETSMESEETKFKLGTMQIKSEDLIAIDGTNGYRTLRLDEACSSSQYQNDEDIVLNGEYRDEEGMESLELENLTSLQDIEIDADDVLKSSLSDECKRDVLIVTNHADELKKRHPLKPTKLKIISKVNSSDLECPPQLKFIAPDDVPASDGDNVMSTRPLSVEDGSISSSVWRYPSNSERKIADGARIKIKIKAIKGKIEGYRQDQGGSTSKITGTRHDMEFDSPEIVTGGMRRTRSTRLKSTSQEIETDHKNFRPKPNLKAEGSSRPTTRSRSTRSRGGTYTDDDLPNTAPDWLLLPRQEDGYRYIPQLGDEVVYLRQGHEEYLESIGDLKSGPWLLVKGIGAVEFCSIESLKYSTLRGSGESCCRLILKFIDPSSAVSGVMFRLTLSELYNFPDFLVERTRYEAAILRNWSGRDKCLVWWREDRGQSSNWWEGRILSSRDKSNDYPGSPWERYSIQYKSDLTNMHLHSPWELHDLEIPWEPPHIDNEIRDELLSSFGHLTRSVRNQERYGILRLNQIATKSDFQNRFAVPLSPALIELRLRNSYYRGLVAVKHDINVILSNAKSYFEKNAEVTDKVKRLSDWFSKTFSNLEVYDDE